MSIANALRKRFNRPIKFDEKRAMDQAHLDAHFDLARLRNRYVEMGVSAWQHIPDEATDGVCCDRGIENADLAPGWPELSERDGLTPKDFES